MTTRSCLEVLIDNAVVLCGVPARPGRLQSFGGAAAQGHVGVDHRTSTRVSLKPWLVALAACAAVTAAAQTVDSVVTNRLTEPYGLTVEGTFYYVTDSANDRIVKINFDTGAFSTLAGFAGRPGTADGKGVYARFFNPRGLVSAPSLSGLVVADYGNHTLRLVKLDGTVTTLAGTAGEPGFDATHFNYPSALAVDDDGNLFIADSKNNAIRKRDAAGNITTVVSGLREPSGVAVGENGDLWVSESRNHTVKRVSASGVVELAAGTPGQSGAVDSVFASETLLNGPTALLWVNAANGLLVCDSGNHTLRRVYSDPEIVGYSVETYAGTPAQPGYVDGALLEAKFNIPISVIKDPTGGFLVVDLGNNAVRRIRTSPPRPPVANPVIGYVTFIKDQFGEFLSRLDPVTEAVFYNDVTIAVLAEKQTDTYYTRDTTPPSTLEDTIPSPTRFDNYAPKYMDGLHAEDVPISLDRGNIPDVTFKLIGIGEGRRPSSVVQARFVFKVANPLVVGDNPAQFTVNTATANAEMWYTTDGATPVPHVAGSTRVVSGETVSLGRIAQPLTFKVAGFRPGFKDSEITTKVFTPDDYSANKISFGFEQGEASSQFVASAGQTFYAPVTLSLLPEQKMYTLQFNVTVKGVGSSPPVDKGAVGFESMLEWQLKEGVYITIPPALFLAGQSGPPPVEFWPGFGNLQVTNTVDNLLAVGWLERSGHTNLYDTVKQDLITYSMAHDTVFLSKDQKVVVGGYNFSVPANASDDATYQIQIGRPSATSDGVGRDNFIEAVTDGDMTLTAANRINSIKIVTVGHRRYKVGDVSPFRWFNAGDFGDDNLLNNDVVQVFQSAIYGLNQPPRDSDFFDAMDSSDGTTNSVYLGDDLEINKIAMGDKSLNVDDVYVTFRRSLDPSLTNYVRYWVGGQRTAEWTPNQFRGAANLPAERFSFRASDLPASSFIPGQPSVAFSVADQVVAPGQTLAIPVQSRVVGDYPLRVLMLNLSVEPLDGSTALSEPVEFVPAATLGDPTLTKSSGANNFAGAWLNNKVAGVAGATTVGYLKFTVPTNALPDSVYRIHFEHASASPNGLGLFPKQLQDGLLMLKERSGSSVGDSIPDPWRLRYFGSVSNVLAQASADADGDGVSNLAEYKAGTNPVDVTSRLSVAAEHRSNSAEGPRPLTLHWPSVLNKSYTVEAASSLTSTDWTALGTGLIGTGGEMQFTPTDLNASAQFFRVRLSE